MRFNFGKVFQEKSKDQTMEGIVNIPSDTNLWPKMWREINYKTYKRFKSIPLPKPIPKLFGHEELFKRSSAHDFASKPMSLQEISNIIYYSCGELPEENTEGNIAKNRRMQASAGSRYPLEIYLINFIKGELVNKCYHYNVKDHSLEELWSTEIIDKKEINKYFNYEWARDASLALVVTGVPSRSVMKYGERGYKYMYLESGAVLHNIQINSMLENRRSVIMGGINEKNVEDLLDLDGENETVILGVLVG